MLATGVATETGVVGFGHVKKQAAIALREGYLAFIHDHRLADWAAGRGPLPACGLRGLVGGFVFFNQCIG